MIAYPNAFVFVLNKHNRRLLKALELGFERAMADGSLQRLLQQRFFTPWLKRHLRLRERRMVVLSTPATEAVRAKIPSSAWLVPWNRIPRANANGAAISAAILCKKPFFVPLC